MHKLQITTKMPNLILLEMSSIEDDAKYYTFQNENLEYIKEFGNTIDTSVQKVTERRLKKSNGRFGIYKGNQLVGMVGYSIKDESTVEVGILLAKSKAGKGYASASLSALVEFIRPKFRTIIAEADQKNTRSIALLKRCGFQEKSRETKDWGKATVFEFVSPDPK